MNHASCRMLRVPLARLKHVCSMCSMCSGLAPTWNKYGTSTKSTRYVNLFRVFRVFHVFRVDANIKHTKTQKAFISILLFNGTYGTSIKSSTYLGTKVGTHGTHGTCRYHAWNMHVTTRNMQHESCPTHYKSCNMESFMAILAFYEHSSAGQRRELISHSSDSGSPEPQRKLISEVKERYGVLHRSATKAKESSSSLVA
jgi:hypothetical protein